MVEKREPSLMCVTGMKKVGKTYTTLIAIEKYIKPNSSTGKEGRKVLIYDVNMEYTKYKAISIKDIRKWMLQAKVEVRRVLPIMENGKMATIDEMVALMLEIVENFRGGMLILEDINRYMIGTKNTEVIGLLATNRHRDLDIICHYQSLSALDPRMWQNTNFVRFHYQMDNVKRYAQRIPNFELFRIAQCLVNYQALRKGNRRFYCFIACDENYITGNFTKLDFEYACKDYLKEYAREVNEVQKRFGKDPNAREKAINYVVKELFLKYYRGI